MTARVGVIVVVAMVAFWVGRQTASHLPAPTVTTSEPIAAAVAPAPIPLPPPVVMVRPPKVVVTPAEEKPDALRVKDLIHNASDLLEKGKAKEAMQRIDNAIAANPGNPELLTQAAGFQLRVAQNPGKAAELYQKAYDQNPKDTEAFNGIVDSLESMGNQAAAIDTMRKIADQHPDRFEPNLALGDMNLRAGKPAEAFTAFENARRADPTDPQAYERLARYYETQKQPEKAAQALLKGEELIDAHIRKSQENGLETPKMERDKLSIRRDAIEALIAAGNSAEASRLFDEIETRVPRAEAEKVRERIASIGSKKKTGE